MTCDPSRRRALALGCAAAGVPAASVLLTACGGSSSEGSGAAPATATSTASASSGTTVVALSEVPVGGATTVTVEGAPYLVTQPQAGEVAAFSAVCPHQGCAVNPADGELDCPCHGSTFDLATGARLSGPADTGLTPLPVTVSGTDVVTA